MKSEKLFLQLFFSLGISFFFISAIHSPSFSKESFSKEKADKDTVYVKTLFYRSNKMHAFFSISYPVISGLTPDSLQKAKNNEFKTDAEKRKQSWVDQITDDFKHPDIGCIGFEYYTYEIQPGLITQNCLSYKIIKSGTKYCSINHVHEIECITIKLSNNVPLELKDIFPGIDSTVWADTLAAKAKKNIRPNDLKDMGGNPGFFVINYFNNENFVLDNTGISFLIHSQNPNYEDESVHRDIWLTIPYSELKSIVTPQSVLWEVVNKK
jgi:hypothetical protein